jgi:hypothetical protein
MIKVEIISRSSSRSATRYTTLGEPYNIERDAMPGRVGWSCSAIYPSFSVEILIQALRLRNKARLAAAITG